MIQAILIFLLLLNLNPSDAERIIDEAILAHGGKHYENSKIEFDLRGRHYSAYRSSGSFRYERTFEDTLGFIRDVLTNDSVYREISGTRMALSARQKAGIQSSVNSVIYFALLPFPLNDPAVRKKYLGTAMVLGEPYHKIEITFAKEGGGRNYEDRFVYWIHKTENMIGYLAYTFQDDGGGTRFRQAVNTCVINGIRSYDYWNFTSGAIGAKIEDFDRILEDGKLDKVSEILLENIRVILNPN
jgi:hypothetical protein